MKVHAAGGFGIEVGDLALRDHVSTSIRLQGIETKSHLVGGMSNTHGVVHKDTLTLKARVKKQGQVLGEYCLSKKKRKTGVN